MRAWPAALAAVLALSATAGEATAAKKKTPPRTCKIVTDAANDATGTGTVAPGPNDGPLDIRYADIASDASRITVVMGLEAINPADPLSVTGQLFRWVFLANKTTYSLEVVVTAATQPEWHGGSGTGVLDLANKEIRLTMPVSAISGLQYKAGSTKLSYLRAETVRWGGHTRTTNFQVSKVDGAENPKSNYTAGGPSCVKVGA